MNTVLFILKLTYFLLISVPVCLLLLSVLEFTSLTRRRAAVARGAHNPEVGGSIPPVASLLVWLK